MTAEGAAPRHLVFGLTWQGAEDPRTGPLRAITNWMSGRLQRKVAPRVALSYAELIEMVRSGAADMAWLPPIVYVQLERLGAVAPLVNILRLGAASFQAALVVHVDSPIDGVDSLFGASAAWVDKYSAAGFVIPRAVLAARKLHPEVIFREERFYGSHEAVVRAVLSGRAQVGGTFARVDADGRFIPGMWPHTPGADQRLRPLITFGSIPGDVIAVRADLDEGTRGRLVDLFVAASTDPVVASSMRTVLGADAFQPGQLEGYDLFREAKFD